MYRHILVPTDGSPLSQEAISHAVSLAAETGAKVTFVTVTEPFHTFSLVAEQIQDTPAEHRRHMKQRAEQTLAAAHAVAQAADVVHTVDHAEDDQPHRAIGAPRPKQAATLSRWRLTDGGASRPSSLEA